MASFRGSCLLLCFAALVLAAAGQRAVTSGSGGPCSTTRGGVGCNSDATCAMWVNGGTCCVGAFQTKIGDYCNVPNGVCCMDSLMCSGNKCVKAGPPPCKSFAPLNAFCDITEGKCCGGNRVSCTNKKCTSPFPPAIAMPSGCRVQMGIGKDCDDAKGICCGGLLPTLQGVKCVGGKCVIPCNAFASIGGSCDLARGKCCGGNRVSCISGRCISSFPPPKPANTPAVVVVVVKPAAVNKPPTCSKYAGIGDSCDPARGFCCGGNKVSCTNGRCISPYPTNTPAPVNKPPVTCTNYVGIGGNCAPERGWCCGGNRISCTNGRCISPYPTGHKLA